MWEWKALIWGGVISQVGWLFFVWRSPAEDVCILSPYLNYISNVAYEDNKSSQVNTLHMAKSQTRSKQNKGMHKFKSVYSERGVLLPVLTSGGE